MSRGVDVPGVVNIADLRWRAERRLPRAVFDYIDGGADAELTLRENCRVFDDVVLRPRNAVAIPQCDLGVTVLGQRLALPFMLAPVGSSRMFYPRGEEAAARAAGAAGTAYILSTLSGCRLEDVKAATKGPAWYQLYLVGGREVASAAISRARAAGYSALAVTIDTAVSGLRERDVRNGTKELLGSSVLKKLPFLSQFLARPRWLAGFLRDGGLMSFPNVVLPGQGPMPYADVAAALEQSTVAWADLGWIREVWRGPIVIKGVLTADDARRAVDEGAEAIVVSNHGGRQLDGVSATLRALPEVAGAVNGRTEVLLDGGIRRGTDIVKALCLGARAVLCGRAYAYGLGAGGEAGVTRAIQILRTDLIPHAQALGLPVGPRARPLLRRSAGRLARRHVTRCSGSVEMTGDLVAARLVAQDRLDLGAHRQRLRAARVEAAARRRIEGARHLALQDDLVAHVVGVRGQRVVQQDLRVRVQRIRVELVGVGGLDELAQVHDADARADVLHHRQIVSDEEIAHARAILDLAQEVHHLSADRDVERRHRLVQQDALGIRGQRARDRDPLALAAGELVRVVVGDTRP